MTSTFWRVLPLGAFSLLAGAAYGQGGVTPPSSVLPAKPPAAASAQEPVHYEDGQPGNKQGWSVHFQQTVIKQWHGEFRAPYQDSLSLQVRENAKLSLTTTAFIGRRLWQGGAVFVNPEVSGGSGLSGASGVAGALNGETFRVGSAEPVLYLARLFLQQRFALTDEVVDDDDDFNQLGGPRPTRYLGVVVGKISLADYFDQNSYSHDPRTQFFNWSLMSAGGWDYPANTRGYTGAVVVQYVSPGLAVRAATALMPTYANGPDLDYDYGKAHAEVVELTKVYSLRGHPGTVRLLGYRNQAGMGSYTQALQPQYALYENGRLRPNLLATRQARRTKYGFVVNAEQEITPSVGLFGRLSWDDGKNETWAFTEIDRSLSLGITSDGRRWHRPTDRVGLAVVGNGLSPEHRAYLARGGYGFILGDGALTYATEFITELYYSIDFPKYHAALSPDYQLVLNPGYNQDRQGPIHVAGLRLHVEF